MEEKYKIIQGDCLEKLKELPSESVNCVITSPPYWALRDYGVEGQIGLEPNFDDYINKLCDIFDEVKRVLRKDGTCWVNIGDTFYTKSGGKFENDNLSNKSKEQVSNTTGINKANEIRGGKYLQSKSLVNIPARFSLEMINRGWILRNEIIWHKPNCMPSSVADRFTVDFEKIFFFVKNQKYWFETQREPHSEESMKDLIRRGKNKRVDINYLMKTGTRKIGVGLGEGEKGSKNLGTGLDADKKGRDRLEFYHPDGRNKRAVWTIRTKPYKGAHFAVFPPELCVTPIKAGCPKYICNKCGELRKIIYTKIGEKKVPPFGGINHTKNNPTYSSNTTQNIYDKKLSNCGCNEGFRGGIVLDPFMGSGTTGVVALQQGRKFIGIELNPEYIELAEKRIKPYAEQNKLEV